MRFPIEVREDQVLALIYRLVGLCRTQPWFAWLLPNQPAKSVVREVWPL
jgi:hypothetical protein